MTAAANYPSFADGPVPPLNIRLRSDPSAFELLDARPGHTERLGDLSVGHRAPHFPDRLPFDQRQLGRECGGRLDGGVDGADPVGRVGDGTEGVDVRHGATVYPLLANVQGNLYTLTMANTRLTKRDNGWNVLVEDQVIGWVVRAPDIKGWRAYTWLPHWVTGVQVDDGRALRSQAVDLVVEWTRNRWTGA